MKLEEIADSRIGKGIKVVTQKGEDESFLNRKNIFYTAYVNEEFWTGSKVFFGEKYLIIFRYNEAEVDEKGYYRKDTVARFAEGEWLSARVIE